MGLKRKLMEFFGDDIEDEDEDITEEPLKEEKKEVEPEQQTKPQQKATVNRVEYEKQPEEKKGIGSLFGVGGKKEENTKMTSKVSYVAIIRPKVFEDSRLIADSVWNF